MFGSRPRHLRRPVPLPHRAEGASPTRRGEGVRGGGGGRLARCSPAEDPPPGASRHPPRKGEGTPRCAGGAKLCPTSPKRASRAVGEDRVDREHVVAHDAVADRARAAGVVAGHAADGGAAEVDASTGNHRPEGPSWRLSSSSTMPGSTMQVSSLASKAMSG